MRKLAAYTTILLLSTGLSRAAIIFTYDFPGNPGTGVAGSQSGGPPTPNWETFSDFTRTGGLTVMPGAPSNNTFGTETWNLTGSIDTTQYEGFSITAGAGVHLNLTSLSFDLQLKPSGPVNFEVGLFLNGSSTAYATLDLTPTSTLTTYNFDFTDLTDADNVTLAEFKFFGWNAAATGGGIVLDNVITNGAIVPEASSGWSALLPISLSAYSLGQAVLRQRRRILRKRTADI